MPNNAGINNNNCCAARCRLKRIAPDEVLLVGDGRDHEGRDGPDFPNDALAVRHPIQVGFGGEHVGPHPERDQEGAAHVGVRRLPKEFCCMIINIL